MCTNVRAPRPVPQVRWYAIKRVFRMTVTEHPALQDCDCRQRRDHQWQTLV